jgi:hypothetical protein
MGFVPTWRHLGLCRVLLGTFEVGELTLALSSFMKSNQNQAGFFPAMVYIITTWYESAYIRDVILNPFPSKVYTS